MAASESSRRRLFMGQEHRQRKWWRPWHLPEPTPTSSVGDAHNLSGRLRAQRRGRRERVARNRLTESHKVELFLEASLRAGVSQGWTITSLGAHKLSCAKRKAAVTRRDALRWR
jgi:hypothetical protein